MIFFPPTWAELCQYSRPICLGEDEDLSLNLETRTGAVAGWGTTVVDYEYSQCGYKKGVTRPDSLSKVLKKLLGLRWHTFDSNWSSFLSIFKQLYQIPPSGRMLRNIRRHPYKPLPCRTTNRRGRKYPHLRVFIGRGFLQWRLRQWTDHSGQTNQVIMKYAWKIISN